MHVEIDQARAEHPPGGVQDLGSGRPGVGAGLRADRRDLAVHDQ